MGKSLAKVIEDEEVDGSTAHRADADGDEQELLVGAWQGAVLRGGLTVSSGALTLAAAAAELELLGLAATAAGPLGLGVLACGVLLVTVDGADAWQMQNRTAVGAYQDEFFTARAQEFREEMTVTAMGGSYNPEMPQHCLTRMYFATLNGALPS